MPKRPEETAVCDLCHLPVFNLVGGSKKARTIFLHWVMTETAKRALQAVVLDEEEAASAYWVAFSARRYDLVFVDAASDIRMQQIFIEHRGTADHDLFWLNKGSDEMEDFMQRLIKRLEAITLSVPVWGCVLIGGRSSRMGQPKHLIKDDRGKTWLENTLATLTPLLNGVVISGNGTLPESLAHTVRLPDIPGVVGPLTGILAAGRWHPMASWLLVACDMPHISTAAVEWLLAGRRAGLWGRAPRLAENNHCEPLFAWYDFRAMQLFEEHALSGQRRMTEAAAHTRIEHPVVPDALAVAWQNMNTPDQLHKR